VTEPEAATSPAFWTGVGVIVAAAFGAVVKMIRGSRADDRTDFDKITKRLDAELKAARAEINDQRVQIQALWARTAPLQHDHNSCEAEKNRLTAENRDQQRQLNELRTRLAAMENK
jgi:septal ring factor EnvC (AmiA/AmiB activator)